MKPILPKRKLVWHYTPQLYLGKILETRILRTTDVGIESGERPVIWFSKEQHWEPTAQKEWLNQDGATELLGMSGTSERGRGLGRIGVDPNRVELCDFETFATTSGISAKAVRKMKSRGKKQRANPRNWLASFAPVTREGWAAVEVYNGSRWVPLENWDYNPAAQVEAAKT